MVATGLVRAGIDVCSGHSGFDPRPAIQGSLTVFCNGLPIVRVTDLWALHSNKTTIHQGQGAVGSMTVFCEGIPVMRSLDPLSCGSVAMGASIDTFAG